MVKFNRPLSGTNSQSNSVRQVIQAAIAHQADELRELQLGVEVNLDPGVECLPCDAPLAMLVTELLYDAIARSPRKCDLSVSACRTHRGVEIEIADSTPVDDGTPCNAFSRCAPQSLKALPARLRSAGNVWGCDLYRTRCPQGGQAWTLVLTTRMTLARAA